MKRSRLVPPWLAALFPLWAASAPLHAQVPFLRGDANDDGRMSIADAHYISLWLYGGGPPPPCVKAADANDDGRVGLGGLNGNRGDDVYSIVLEATCGRLESDGCYQHDAVAEPRDAPGEDPTPDDLSCESHTGTAQPAIDPEAKLEILDAVCPGGKSALAVLKVRISHSRPIGGYSGAIDDGAGIFDRVRTVVDVDGTIFVEGSAMPAVVRDGQVLFAYLDRAALGSGYPEHLQGGILPPAKDQVAAKIYLQLAPGIPAGVYPLLLLEGEMADSLTGQAIAPAIVDGLLTVEEDVALDATVDLNVADHRECSAREAVPPAGPEDVQVAFPMAVVAAERGSRVIVPLWVEANAPVEGFTFAIYYGNADFDGKLRLERVVPLEPEGSPWEVFEHTIHPSRPAVWGQAVFSRTDPAASLPPGRLHHVLDLEFQVDATAPSGLARIALFDLFADPELPGDGDWRNAVLAYGRFLSRGMVTCFEHDYRQGGIIVGHSAITPFLRGDANADGALSFADAVLIGRLTQSGSQRSPCEDAADADDSGNVNLSDAIRVFRHLFEAPSAATAIPPPYPEPGLDATLDPTPCESYPVAPAALTGDLVRLGSVEVGPGESILVPIHVTVSKPLDSFQLLVRFDPEVFTPAADRLELEGGAFEGFTPFINFVARDLIPGHVALAFTPDLVGQRAVPPGSDLLVGKIAGIVSDGLSPGDVIRFEPVAFPEGDAPRPDRLRTEVVEVEDGKLLVLLPALEAGTVRVVDGSEPTFLRGDANFDLAVNISDAIFSLSYLFLGGPAPSCDDAADADDSGKLALTDAVFTLSFLFRGGARPLPPPYPERGRDARADELGPCHEPAW